MTATTTATPETTTAYLRSLSSIRTRCHHLLSHPDLLQNFNLHLDKLPEVTNFVLELVKRDYKATKDIPPHSRWRHFEAGNIKRLDSWIETWKQDLGLIETVKRLLDLFVVSVLLDAGAGDFWKYTMLPTSSEAGKTYNRSEGLALASLDWFLNGGFAGDGHSLIVDAKGLKAIQPSHLSSAFQVSETNPLVGVDGRCGLLNRLGSVLEAFPRFFGNPSLPNSSPRPGNIVHFLVPGLDDSKSVTKTNVSIDKLWEVVMEGLSGVWPDTRTKYHGTSLGDVWPCVALSKANALLRSQQNGTKVSYPTPSSSLTDPLETLADSDSFIPFHKLSQWLTYSLMEPLSLLGIEFDGATKMTGLAEYRNGGLFVDMGVIQLKDSIRATLKDLNSENVPRVKVDSDLVIEWRALTVALLDLVGKQVRENLKMSEVELPLVKVLEAGTWKAGREVAARLRPKTRGPPIEIISDGTVF